MYLDFTKDPYLPILLPTIPTVPWERGVITIKPVEAYSVDICNHENSISLQRIGAVETRIRKTKGRVGYRFSILK